MSGQHEEDALMPEFGLVHYNFPGSLVEFLDYARDTGFKCTELMIGDVWDERGGMSYQDAEKKAVEIRHLLEDRGMRASALAAGNNFLMPIEAEMAAQVDRVRRVAALAQLLGTNMLRVDGGWLKPGETSSRERNLDLISSGLLRLKSDMESAGIKLALDNHGMVTNDADFQVEIFRRVDSPNLGANLDTMNYRWAGHDLDTVRRYYEVIAPYVFHTHFKDGVGSREKYVGLALGAGEIPLEYAVQCLKAANYQGPWLVEYEGKTDSRAGYRTGLEWLQAHV
jgi:sugar phosphate isomerase/epimerase